VIGAKVRKYQQRKSVARDAALERWLKQRDKNNQNCGVQQYGRHHRRSADSQHVQLLTVDVDRVSN